MVNHVKEGVVYWRVAPGLVRVPRIYPAFTAHRSYVVDFSFLWFETEAAARVCYREQYEAYMTKLRVAHKKAEAAYAVAFPVSGTNRQRLVRGPSHRELIDD